MKKSIIALAAFTLITGSILTSCNATPEKVDNAEKNIDKVNQDLDEAYQEYLTDVEDFRKSTADLIEANNKKIAELKEKIVLEKKEAQVSYQKKITVLEQKNNDLKVKIDTYKAEGKEQWSEFKAEFSKDLDELGTAFGNFFSSK